MLHSFDTEIAKDYGILEAILFNNLVFWIRHSEVNEKNNFDGSYWTFNSIKAFSKLLPYVSEKQIRRALKHLKDEDLIMTGNFNKSSYDRTLWYTLTDKGNALAQMETSICPNGKMDLTKKENGFSREGEPIPDSKHRYKTTIKNTDKEKELSPSVPVLFETTNDDGKQVLEIGSGVILFPSESETQIEQFVTETIEYLNNRTGKNFNPKTKGNRKNIKARLNDGYTLENLKHVIDVKVQEWLHDPKMNQYLNCVTLFRPTKFETYLNQKEKQVDSHGYSDWYKDTQTSEANPDLLNKLQKMQKEMK